MLSANPKAMVKEFLNQSLPQSNNSVTYDKRNFKAFTD